MSMTRREMLNSAALAGGAVIVAKATGALAGPPASEPADKDFTFKDDNPARQGNAPTTGAPVPPGEAGRDYAPVVVPNGWSLPFKIVDGVKVFHLVAEEVDHEFAPGLRARCWGYNGSVHGPVIEAVEGDRVRIFLTNRLVAATTVHWHGILLPSGMDGVGGLSQRAIGPGETFAYEFTLRQNGTFMYHAHHDEMTQIGMGLTGLFVIHPRHPQDPRPDRDFAFMLHEWSIPVGTERPNPNEMTDFNLLTINGRAFPGTDPLVAKLGEKVRIRIGNLSAMDHHPIHLHGHYFKVTETDGGKVPESAQWPETTVLVGVGQTRTVEFVADNPGDWALHCHMTHHVMNQMGHEFPNMIGVEPGDLDEKVRPLLPAYMTMGPRGMSEMAGHIESGHMEVPPNSIPMIGGHGPHDYITMGGMFTILKVRENLASYADPGWYEPPPGTLASPASADALRANGIAADGSGAPRPPATVKPPAATRPAPTQASHQHPSPASTTRPAGQPYACPMHPEVTAAAPGECPKCGMSLRRLAGTREPQ